MSSPSKPNSTDPAGVEAILNLVAQGALTPADAAARLQGYQSLNVATVDLDRARRRKTPEVIFGQGKSPEHIEAIARTLLEHGQRVLATRLSPDGLMAMQRAAGAHSVQVDELARCALIEAGPVPTGGMGPVAVVCAGTSDLPVAREAAFVARAMGEEVIEIVDVGVAGLHRLLGRLEQIRRAAVVIVVAGMEGALPSVMAGLVDRPLIAVPTSVGYGAHFGGVTALLSMINSCAAGVTVVNIDNGFGAAYAARQMNRAFDPGADLG